MGRSITRKLIEAHLTEGQWRAGAEIAIKIVRDIAQKKSSDPSFISLMIFKIQQIGWSRAPKDRIDYQYWSSKGWLNPRRTFFIKHRANALKVSSARLVGSIVAKFMI